MKIIVLVIILFFSACSKDCKQCIRTWEYVGYRLNENTGVKFQFTYPPSTQDQFEACGDNEIEQAEKVQKTHVRVEPYRDGWMDGTGTCHCD